MISFVMILNALLGFVLVTAAAAKVEDLDGFVLSFRVLKIHRVTKPLSLMVPAVELVLGIWLVVAFTSLVAYFALALCVLFVLVNVYSLTLSTPTPCNCFGSLSKLERGWSSLARSALLAIVAVVVLVDRHELAVRLGRSRSVFMFSALLGCVVSLFALAFQASSVLRHHDEAKRQREAERQAHNAPSGAVVS